MAPVGFSVKIIQNVANSRNWDCFCLFNFQGRVCNLYHRCIDNEENKEQSAYVEAFLKDALLYFSKYTFLL
jgi:hypothetical protein